MADLRGSADKFGQQSCPFTGTGSGVGLPSHRAAGGPAGHSLRGKQMEVIVPILVQLVGGGVGGNVIGQLAKSLNLGTAGNTIVGAIGGIAGTWLAGMVPGLDGLVGAAAGAAGTAGGLDLGALVGQGATGLVSGGILTAIAGFIKSSMAKA